MIALLLLVASLAQAQEVSTGTTNLLDEVRISNLGKDTRDLLSGRYRQTGKPTFANGFCFADGTCQTTAPASVVNASTATLLQTAITGDTSATAVCVAGSTLTFTTRAGPVDLIFDGTMSQDGGGNKPLLSVLVDGAFLPGFSATVPMRISRDPGGTSMAYFPVSMRYRTRSSLSAAAHSFCIVFNRGSGSGTATLQCGESPCNWEIREVQ